MKRKLAGAIGTLGFVGAFGIGAVIAPQIASADSISSVENARAKDRAGYHVSRQDREKLRRYGRNDDGYYGGGYNDYYGPSNGGVSLYVGPRSYGGDYYDD